MLCSPTSSRKTKPWSGMIMPLRTSAPAKRGPSGKQLCYIVTLSGSSHDTHLSEAVFSQGWER